MRSPLCVARLELPLKPASGVMVLFRVGHEEVVKHYVYGRPTVHNGGMAAGLALQLVSKHVAVVRVWISDRIVYSVRHCSCLKGFILVYVKGLSSSARAKPDEAATPVTLREYTGPLLARTFPPCRGSNAFTLV